MVPAKAIGLSTATEIAPHADLAALCVTVRGTGIETTEAARHP